MGLNDLRKILGNDVPPRLIAESWVEGLIADMDNRSPKATAATFPLPPLPALPYTDPTRFLPSHNVGVYMKHRLRQLGIGSLLTNDERITIVLPKGYVLDLPPRRP